MRKGKEWLKKALRDADDSGIQGGRMLMINKDEVDYLIDQLEYIEKPKKKHERNS